MTCRINRWVARYARPKPAASSSSSIVILANPSSPPSLSVGRMLNNNCPRSNPAKCWCQAVTRNHSVGSSRSNEQSIVRRWRTSATAASCSSINRSVCASGMLSLSGWGGVATPGVTAVYRFHPGALKNCRCGWLSSHIRLAACLAFSRTFPSRFWQFRHWCQDLQWSCMFLMKLNTCPHCSPSSLSVWGSSPQASSASW